MAETRSTYSKLVGDFAIGKLGRVFEYSKRLNITRETNELLKKKENGKDMQVVFWKLFEIG